MRRLTLALAIAAVPTMTACSRWLDAVIVNPCSTPVSVDVFAREEPLSVPELDRFALPERRTSVPAHDEAGTQIDAAGSSIGWIGVAWFSGTSDARQFRLESRGDEPIPVVIPQGLCPTD